MLRCLLEQCKQTQAQATELKRQQQVKSRHLLNRFSVGGGGAVDGAMLPTTVPQQNGDLRADEALLYNHANHVDFCPPAPPRNQPPSSDSQLNTMGPNVGGQPAGDGGGTRYNEEELHELFASLDPSQLNLQDLAFLNADNMGV